MELWFAMRIKQSLIRINVSRCHVGGSESRVEIPSYCRSVHLSCGLDSRCGIFHRFYDEARLTVCDHFRHRPVSPSNYRCSGRHGLNHHEPKRLWPVDWEKQGTSFPKERAFLLLVYFSNEFDEV